METEIIEKLAQDVISKRNEIIENFIKTWLAVKIPKNYSIDQFMDFWANNCALCIQANVLNEEGKLVDKYWMEQKPIVKKLSEPVSMEAEIIERLYHSEINIQIETNYDGGYYFRLGDYQNGTGPSHSKPDFKSTVKKLAELAVKKYPESEFAKWWKEQQVNKL
jgi:hypothetical protein